jgi:hypothetical protein
MDYHGDSKIHGGLCHQAAHFEFTFTAGFIGLMETSPSDPARVNGRYPL